MSSQDDNKNAASRSHAGAGSKNTGANVNAGANANTGAGGGGGAATNVSAKAGAGGAKKNRNPSGGAKFYKDRDNKDPEQKDRTIKHESASSAEKPANADRKARIPYYKQPAKNNLAETANNQKPGKTQIQPSVDKQHPRSPAKSQKKDAEPHEVVPATRGAIEPGNRTGQKKNRQLQERGGNGAREHDRQINQEQGLRAHLSGDSQKSGAADAHISTKPHNAQSIGVGNRGKHPQSAHLAKIKVEETIDDIKAEIVRLEKEIDLEIKEIQSMKLAL